MATFFHTQDKPNKNYKIKPIWYKTKKFLIESEQRWWQHLWQPRHPYRSSERLLESIKGRYESIMGISSLLRSHQSGESHYETLNDRQSDLNLLRSILTQIRIPTEGHTYKSFKMFSIASLLDSCSTCPLYSYTSESELVWDTQFNYSFKHYCYFSDILYLWKTELC